MPELTRPVDVVGLASWPRRASHARRAVLVTVLAASAIAFVVDGWYGERIEAHARDEVRALAAARADAVLRTATREVSLLGALASFTETRATRAQLDAEFPTFVQGVLSGRGLRALQLVERSRIVAVWPLAGNERSLGLAIDTHPDLRVRDGLSRAIRTGRTTITGPVPLVQGGTGLIVRQRLATRPGFPDLAAIVLDVPDLVASAGIPDPRSGVRLELRDRSGRWFAGDPEGTAILPESVAIPTGDGTFHLLAAPVEGWTARTARWRRAERGVLLLSILAVALIARLLGRRRDDLEAEVRRSGTALELVMRASRLGGWEEDLATGIVRWNSTIDAIIGRPTGAAVEGVERLAAAVDPSDRPRLATALARARAGEAAGFLEEVRITGGGGEPRWVLVLGDVGRDASGRPVRIVGVVADATERRALQARLRHAQRLEALGKLAGGVAHDFNNLLTAIGAFAELARERADELPPDVAPLVRADLDQVVASARRGAALTQQLMTFSRDRNGGAPPRAPLDVGASIVELMPTLEQLLAGRARLEPSLAPDLPRVGIDAGQLTQVLTNLVVNARDAMPSGGAVHVRTALTAATGATRPADAPPGRWVVIEVQDEGTGMPAEVRDRIFEPYFTTKPVGQGTGLGLAVVYGIVDSAGGTVTVQSREGAGTTFRLFLPPAAEAA